MTYLFLFLFGWGAISVPFNNPETCASVGRQIEQRFLGQTLWFCSDIKTGQVLP